MADNFKFVQAQPFSLAGSGALLGDATVTLQSFTQINGTLLTMSDFGTVGYGTLEPGNGTLEEPISWTGIVQNANGTATLTGVKTVLTVYPYTETNGLAQSHAGGTTFVVSNTAAFYNKLTAKTDDETITGVWTFTAPNYPQIDVPATLPTADGQFATKKYVDGVAIAGAPDASSTVKGITKLSSNPSVSTNPIALNSEEVSATTGANKVVRANASGQINAGFGGAASSLATLDGSSLVVQDPANATGTPTSGKIAKFNANLSVTVAATPTASTDAASKGYVDLRLVGLGAPVSKSWNTIYQAATDGFIVAYWTSDGGTGVTAEIVSDSSNPPTTVRSYFNAISSGMTGTLFTPVKKNDYYEVVTVAHSPSGATAYFFPLS